ncbi:Rz1 lytic protein [Enterobacteriaceae bacterium LUAb1]
MTYGESIALNVLLYGALEQCNKDKLRIIEIDKTRSLD